MHRERTIAAVDEAFRSAARPKMFIRGTCSCDECQEHEETMQRLDARNPTLHELNHPGWDPICFASNEAFAYLMPGLVRLVLRHPDDYLQQYVFHLSQPERLKGVAPHQARALLDVLEVLALEETRAVDHNLAGDDLLRLREQLEQAAERGL